MSARRKRVISTDEIQFNRKPAKIVLIEKKRVSQNGQTPNIIGICLYCVLDRPVFELNQILLHPELTLWWSSLLPLLMVPTTRNLAAPPTPYPHPRSAVMTCAKLGPDQIILFKRKAIYIFTRFPWWVHQPFGKWAKAFIQGAQHIGQTEK